MSNKDVASCVGRGKSAVSQVLNGNGNIRIETLGEYLAAMGFEADVVLVPHGEISTARRERRDPKMVPVTMMDRDRVAPRGTLVFGVVEDSVTESIAPSNSRFVEHPLPPEAVEEFDDEAALLGAKLVWN